MALAIGTKTELNPVPGADSYTFAHNQNTGSDGFLMVVVTMPDTVDFTGATYDGQTMTLLDNSDYVGLSQRQAVYGIKTPSIGSNNVVISFDGSQWNNSSFYAVSFTGSSGFGNFGAGELSETPNTESITVSENSVVYGTGIAVNDFVSITIDGSLRPFEFEHDTNRQVVGALSLTGLSAGSIDVITAVTTSTVTNTQVEIKEAGGGRRRIMVIS